MSEKQKKTVFRKILESIGYVIGFFACIALGAAFVTWAGGDDKYVITIGALGLVETLREIWSSEQAKKPLSLLMRYALYKKQKKYINDVLPHTRSCRDCGREIGDSERALIVDGELVCSECERKLPRSEDE